MRYRRLGRTGLMVSEIGFGGEWLERHSERECREVLAHAQGLGINILDVWMSNPEVRKNIGLGIAGSREKWYIQGHVGATWQGGQYVRTRDMDRVAPAFEDLLRLLRTDYIDLGMIHFIDDDGDWERAMSGPYIEYVRRLKAEGVIRHIGLSTHNPLIAMRAAQTDFIEMILFSVNPAFDLLPPTDNIEDYFAEEYSGALKGIDPVRAALYSLCEQKDVGINVMKGFAGGRLFDARRSPFGVALTPVQCLHYCLTRPAVASVLVGYDTAAQVDEAVAYETATDEEKNYAAVLAGAPLHAFPGGQCTYCGHCRPCPAHIDIAMVNKYFDLAAMQPRVPATLREHYRALPHRADECIACRQCEPRCPFSVPISDRMKQAAKLFSEG